MCVIQASYCIIRHPIEISYFIKLLQPYRWMDYILYQCQLQTACITMYFCLFEIFACSRPTKVAMTLHVCLWKIKCWKESKYYVTVMHSVCGQNKFVPIVTPFAYLFALKSKNQYKPAKNIQVIADCYVACHEIYIYISLFSYVELLI